MKTGNLLLQEKFFSHELVTSASKLIPLDAIGKKCVLLFLLLIGSTVFSSYLFFHPTYEEAMFGLFIFGMLGVVVLPILSIFKVTWSPVIAPIYAMCEGAFLGFVSSFLEKSFHGIFYVAVVSTFVIFILIFMMYRLKIIKVSSNFVKGMTAVLLTMVVMYFLRFLAQAAGIQHEFLYGGGILGIIFNVATVIVASLCFVLDFAFITEVSSRNLAPHIQWFAAMGLIVTFTWLYIEILRLLFVAIKES